MAVIPGFDLTIFAQNAGPIAALLLVAAIIFAESGLLIGFFLPSDSIIFTLGFLIQGSSVFSDLNIVVVIIVLFLAAVIGDNTGYTFGKKIGPKLFNRPNSLLFKQENVIKAQEFYETYGAKTIIFARFVPIIRTFAPLVAGVAKMNHKTFFIFNVIGGALWTVGITLLGYFLGFYLKSLGIDIDTVLLPIIALILFISALPPVIHVLKNKKQREAIWNATKLQFKKIFKSK